MKHLVWLAPALFAISPVQAAELVRNGGFDATTDGWWGTPNLGISVEDGKLCTEVPGGTVTPWDAIVGTNDIALVKGEGYDFAFSYSGAPGGPVRALVQMPVDPYTSYVELTPRGKPEAQDAARTFKAPADRPDGQVAFQIGGSIEPWTFCLDNVSLTGGAEVAAHKPDTGPRIRVNQLGYLPDGPKRATLVTDTGAALPFTLNDASGAAVFEGMTVPHGLDPSAGFNVQTLDFSAATAIGEGFTISVEAETSYPFDIRADLYQTLVADAMSYYYPVRSGIEILDEVAGPGYGRPAGHVSRPGGGDVNQGDIDVPCQSAASSLKAYGEAWTCDYTLDVSGGWYDAGDHGKYVVNGGISVGQLMAAFRRASRASEPDHMRDRKLRIPEHGNGVPDVLDEARWELDWMLKMVVPDGQPLAGMVHHKVQDSSWTGIPLLPSNDDKVRELHRPSTAATLNFAAVAAAGARYFSRFDRAFIDRLRAAATKSYAAAKAHPELFATSGDGTSGGGGYDDDDVTDEFYWAAAELFVTTGDPAYLADLKASPLWDDPGIFRVGGFDWKNVGGFARLLLASEPRRLSGPDSTAIRQSVVDGADMLLALQQKEPFGQTYTPSSGRYDWGSTHLVIQNALVLAAAYDITGHQKYRDGALEAMDYVFGRNALNQSYVTGYGEHSSHNQHSRWFAKSVNADFPPPPRGALAGGPNSSIQDPVVQALFAETGCAPQTCYVDDIGAWSVNEITINWNAALGQMAGWLASQ